MSTGFNGGSGNCPAKLLDGDHRHWCGQASMEGRAIARPNVNVAGVGDPGMALQWRAGQLPGQTSRSPRIVARLLRPEPPASMEGRAIARPNIARVDGRRRSGWCGFNGGPGNCPAKQSVITARYTASTAGSGFNGGPGNCPAKR